MGKGYWRDGYDQVLWSKPLAINIKFILINDYLYAY